MPTLRLPLLLAVTLALSALPLQAARAACDPWLARELAWRYAPVHHQDADSDNYRGEMLTRIDFDGDWVMNDNWDASRAFTSNPAPYGYYSVVSTPTHWYVLYAFYHPQDWSDVFWDAEHENDLEGVLVIVARDGTQYGRLEGAVTVAHSDHYSYLPAGSRLSANQEGVDGTLQLRDGTHPVTFQEAKGHGLYAYGGSRVQDSDGIWYYPSRPYRGTETATAPGTPTTASGDAQPTGYYQLLDLFAVGGLWDRRNDTATFSGYGTFRGDGSGGCGDGAKSCSSNAANAPWGWDDKDDTPGRGALATDPASLTSLYFRSSVPLSRTYDCNPYQGLR
jgi:hypothetical protein